MTVRITKPEFNLREKISELDKPTGIKGLDLMRSDTSQDARDFISAGRKNLIINGAMLVAQRGTSTTTLGYLIDRFLSGAANINNPTYAQVDVASGTQPYAAGFRKAAKYTGADNAVHSNDVLKFNQKIEAQHIATSGWDYTSGSSFITLSFWVKSSISTTFFGRLQSYDGTNQNYVFSYDVVANTWTKVVKTIPGNANITINNDTGLGLDIEWTLYRGIDTTSSDTVVNLWQTYSSSKRLPDGVPSTWHDTNAATWEITGIQLEVGRNATEFEHRSFGEELALCQRYFYMHANGSVDGNGSGGSAISDNASAYNSDLVFFTVDFPVTMRSKPALAASNGSGHYGYYTPGGNLTGFDTLSLDGVTTRTVGNINFSVSSAFSGGQSILVRTKTSDATLAFNAEL